MVDQKGRMELKDIVLVLTRLRIHSFYLGKDPVPLVRLEDLPPLLVVDARHLPGNETI